jgi:hypothetical protein
LAGATTVKLKKWILGKLDQIEQGSDSTTTKANTKAKLHHSQPHPHSTKKTKKELEEEAKKREEEEEMEDVVDEYLSVHNLKLVFCSVSSATQANLLEAFELITLQTQLRLNDKENNNKKYEIRRRYRVEKEVEETIVNRHAQSLPPPYDQHYDDDDDDDGDEVDSYEQKLRNGVGVVSPPIELKEVALSDVLAAVANSHRMFDVIQRKIDEVIQSKHWTIANLFASCDGNLMTHAPLIHATHCVFHLFFSIIFKHISTKQPIMNIYPYRYIY